jgi:hypothetical protein
LIDLLQGTRLQDDKTKSKTRMGKQVYVAGADKGPDDRGRRRRRLKHSSDSDQFKEPSLLKQLFLDIIPGSSSKVINCPYCSKRFSVGNVRKRYRGRRSNLSA